MSADCVGVSNAWYNRDLPAGGHSTCDRQEILEEGGGVLKKVGEFMRSVDRMVEQLSLIHI